MMKLLKIEWTKLAGHRFFWIGMSLYILCVILIITQIGNFRFNSNSDGGLVQFDDFATAGIYELPHIWKHMSYMAAYLKIIPAFLLIFFVSNEFQYRTFRQNIIDGLSLGQAYFSKVLLAILFSLLSLLVVVLVSYWMAVSYNPDASFGLYLKGMDYLVAYFAEVFTMMCFGLFLTVLFRRSTISIIIIVVYYYVIENFLTIRYGAPLNYFLPTAPSRELNLQFFTTLLGGDALLGTITQEQVPLKYLLLTILDSLIFILGGFLILKKRDL